MIDVELFVLIVSNALDVKKEGEDFCGTHIKGTPHGVISNKKSEPTQKKNSNMGRRNKRNY